MKVYMSYWSGGYQKAPKEDVINLNKLAAFYAAKHYGEVTLITDSVSKPFFETEPFTNITTDLDVFNGVENKNWALGKLYAYKLAAENKEPFIHIDYDCFLIKPLEKEYEISKVLVQSTELTAYKNYSLDLFYKNIGENIGFTEPNSNHMAYNMGIFGGTEYDFIKEYAETAIQFSLNPKNKKVFEIMHNYRTWAPACILEQYYLWVLSEKYNIPVTRYLEGDDTTYEGKILLEVESNKKGYVHLMGVKNANLVREKIKERLEEFQTKEKVDV